MGVSAVACDVELHSPVSQGFFCTHTYISVSSCLCFSFSPARFAFLHIHGRPLCIFDMIIDGVPTHHDPVDSEAGSGWKEKEFDDGTKPQYQDAFGDETNAEVKYKTMEWW